MADDALNLSALLGPVDPAQDKRAEALRRLGSMYVMSGARGISDAGTRLLGEADKRREIGLEAPERAVRLLGAQKAYSEIQAERDPSYRRALLGAINRGAPGLADETTPVHALRLLVPFSQKAEDRAVDVAESARRAKADAERMGLERARLGLDRERVQQDAYSAVADPVTGRVVVYNKKTGEERQLPPGAPASPPAGPGAKPSRLDARPLPGVPGKPTERQRNEVLDASAGLAKLDLAAKAFEDAPGAWGGAKNVAAGIAENITGETGQSLLRRRFSPAELSAKNQVENIVSEIITKRAGASQTLQELLRQTYLPKVTDSQEQVRRKLADLREFLATDYVAHGGGMVPDPRSGGADASPGAAPAAALPRKAVGGKTYEKRADGWYEVD